MPIRPSRICSTRFLLIALVSLAAAIPCGAQAQASAKHSPPAKSVEIVFLGTGKPTPIAYRQGPALAIIANGKAYMVDAGTGVIRRADTAFRRGIPALRPRDIDIAFLTHLHSDHTLGLPDMILTPWTAERTKPLRLYGPEGTKEMAENILKAYKEDIRIRTTGLEEGNKTGYKVEAHDIQPGNIYKDENISVKAFLVHHGSWKEALGYRFDADGRSIVFSGDTSPIQSVIDACNGCDALIHEVYVGRGVPGNKANTPVDQWMKYESEFHTSATELGKIATEAKAKMLIVTHSSLLGGDSEEDLVHVLRENYNGPIVIANDLDVIAP